MNKKLVSTVALSAFVLSNMPCAQAVAPAQPTAVTATKKKRLFKKGKVLSCKEQVDILNIGLAGFPTSLLRMEEARNKAYDVLHDTLPKLLKDDKKVVHELMHSILTPLQEFFDNIRGYASMVRPLVEESILGKDATRNPDGTPVHNSILLQFFEKENKDMVDVFFEKHVSNRADLEKVCNEIITFMSDVRANWSEATKHAFEAIVKKANELSHEKQTHHK